MALIKCPECGKEISDKAGACIHCGCPIANKPTSIKIRFLSDDKHCKHFLVETPYGRRECTTGSVLTLNISSPKEIVCIPVLGIFPTGFRGRINARPGKCYEVKHCKTSIIGWGVVVSEVSFIG